MALEETVLDWIILYYRVGGGEAKIWCTRHWWVQNPEKYDNYI
jgi:hypothetical protein